MPIAKAPQAFPRPEYLRRLALVKAEMEKHELDALIVTSGSNITWLTGNFARIFSHHGLVIMPDKEEPSLVVRAMDVPAFRHQTYLQTDNVIGYSDDYIGKADKNGYDAVIDFLHEAGYANRRVGIEFNGAGGLGMGMLQPATAEKFKARLPKSADCTRLVDPLRVVKSDLEIAVMREAGAIADAAIMRAAEVMRAGVREVDIAAEVMAAQARGPAGGKPATSVMPPLICTSPRTGTAHIMWSEDELRKGSQINIELSGSRYNYMAAIMRTFTIGPAPDRLRRLHDAEVAGLEAALDVARPGSTCGDVASAFYRGIEKNGFKKESRCGYAIGIDWHEGISLQLGDTTLLKPNMTFHLMLGNWLEEQFGYVISETFRVTDSRVELLTKAPRKLFEL